MSKTRITKGSITRLGKSDQWRWQPYIDGQRRSYTFPASGKRAASRHVDEVLRPQILAGLLSAPDQWTVAQFLEQWLETRLPALKAPGTREKYAYDVQHYLTPALGAIPVRELTSMQVQVWANQAVQSGRTKKAKEQAWSVSAAVRESGNTRNGPLRVNRSGIAESAMSVAGHEPGGLSPTTVSHCLTVLKMALTWGVDQEPPLLLRNVARKVTVPTAGQPYQAQAYSLQEMMALIATLRPPYGATVAFGFLGLRIGEALGVRRRDDLDFEARLVHVRQQAVQRVGRRDMAIQAPKGGKTRTVPMPEWIVPILMAQLEYSVANHNQTDLLTTRQVRQKGAKAWITDSKRNRHADTTMSMSRPTMAAPANCGVGIVGGKSNEAENGSDWSVEPNRNRDPLTDVPVHGQRVREYLRLACAEAGVRPLVFHALRHTFATVLRKAGVLDLDIAAALGHSDSSLVIRLYGNHPDADKPRNDRLGRVMDALVQARKDETG